MPWVSLKQLKEKVSEDEKIEVTTRFMNGLSLQREAKKNIKKPPKKLEFKRY